MVRMQFRSAVVLALAAGAAMLAGWCFLTVDRAATQAALPTRHAAAVPRSEGVALVAPQLQEAARSTASADEDQESLDLSTRVALLEDENARLMEVNRLLEARLQALERPANTEPAEATLARIAEDLGKAAEGTSPPTAFSALIRAHQ
jgi:hypothetical protein